MTNLQELKRARGLVDYVLSAHLPIPIMSTVPGYCDACNTLMSFYRCGILAFAAVNDSSWLSSGILPATVIIEGEC